MEQQPASIAYPTATAQALYNTPFWQTAPVQGGSVRLQETQPGGDYLLITSNLDRVKEREGHPWLLAGECSSFSTLDMQLPFASSTVGCADSHTFAFFWTLTLRAYPHFFFAYIILGGNFQQPQRWGKGCGVRWLLSHISWCYHFCIFQILTYGNI